jgi:hypothetical protein
LKQRRVSLFNPDFKAINRGKIGKQIEFGLKWGSNQIRGGYISILMHSNMMACDADYSVKSIEEHIQIFGEAPRDFGFDRAACSIKHMKVIKKMGVKNLGIAPKGQAKWKVGPRVQDRMIRERASRFQHFTNTSKGAGENALLLLEADCLQLSYRDLLRWGAEKLQPIHMA